MQTSLGADEALEGKFLLSRALRAGKLDLFDTVAFNQGIINRVNITHIALLRVLGEIRFGPL